MLFALLFFIVVSGFLGYLLMAILFAFSFLLVETINATFDKNIKNPFKPKFIENDKKNINIFYFIGFLSILLFSIIGLVVSIFGYLDFLKKVNLFLQSGIVG